MGQEFGNEIWNWSYDSIGSNQFDRSWLHPMIVTIW